MARYEPEAKYIASIYPSAVEKITQYHGPDQDVRKSRCTIYHMPPVWPGKKPEPFSYTKNVKAVKVGGSGCVHSGWAAVMEVGDAFENVPDTQPEASGRGRIIQLARPVACEDIANNILTSWRDSMIGIPTGAAPGMMIIANTCPTNSELDQMVAMQMSFYEYRLAEGDRLFLEKNIRGITQQMKDAALYLGRERTWSGAFGTVGTVECPHCLSPIHPRASVCAHCQRDVKDTKATVEPVLQQVG